MFDSIQNVYQILENWNISVTALIVIAVVLALAFIFSVREAAVWFFKIGDLKRDVRRLRETALALEGEIRALQSIVTAAKPKSSVDSVPMTDEAATDPASASKAAAFPIVH